MFFRRLKECTGSLSCRLRTVILIAALVLAITITLVLILH